LTTGLNGTPGGRHANVIYPIHRNNRGPTLVVFVPGLAGNARQWDLVLPQLGDLPADLAYGAPLLPHPAFRGTRPTASALALAYADDLSREDRRDVVIVAHSVGTFVALGVARHIPEIVKEVIAVNGGLATAARFLDQPVREFTKRPRGCLNALRLFALVGIPVPPVVKRATANSKSLSRAVLGGLVSDAALNSVERRRIIVEEGGKPQAMQTLWCNRHHWRKFRSYAGQIQSRCVFLVGEQDPIAGVKDTKDMAGLLNAELTELRRLPGVGHAAPVENAEEVTAAIRKSVAALSLG
jgi:pimeloyl-ACP methyl ester carboxylesterase